MGTEANKVTMREVKELAAKALEPWYTSSPENDFLKGVCWNAEFDDFAPDNPAYHPYYQMLRLLAERTKPALIVEVGTELGRGACFLAVGSPSSKVVTIELGGQVPDTYNRWLSSRSNISVVTGTRGSDWASCHRDARIRLLYIDASHEYEQTLEEWCAFRPLMEPGGIICCDDLSTDGVGKMWAEVGLEKAIFAKLHEGMGWGVALVPV